MIRDVDGNVISVQCTFIDPKTGDKIKGEDIAPRLTFGSSSGGAIQLTKATNKLMLCEGVEDGLSILQSAPNSPIWATAGTSGFSSIRIPASVREVTICADNDIAGEKATNYLSERLISEGKEVIIARPPAAFKDFNDLLRYGKNNGS